jgi:hypothetical protein
MYSITINYFISDDAKLNESGFENFVYESFFSTLMLKSVPLDFNGLVFRIKVIGVSVSNDKSYRKWNL